MAAVMLTLFSGALVVYSGMSVFRAVVPVKKEIQSEVELVRIEGKNCPLYFPKEQ